MKMKHEINTDAATAGAAALLPLVLLPILRWFHEMQQAEAATPAVAASVLISC